MILEVIPPLVTECLGVVMVCFAAGFERYTTLLIFIGCAFIFALFFDPLVWKRFALNKDMKFSVILNGSVCALGLIAYFVGYAISGNN
ncbi:MAG: hypothetical protein Q7R94_03100 [bacterium]|nr:hypothetical protein [bacterium]